MKRQIITTADGSKTIQITDWDEQYHSKHGAIQEAYHVFISMGLRLFKDQEVDILEIGFGTGLNAFITYLEVGVQQLKVNYVAVEGYPVPMDEIMQLDYAAQLKVKEQEGVFLNMHHIPWGERVALSEDFILTKQKKDFQQVDDEGLFNLIYFDAFGARVQPGLWTPQMFGRMYRALDHNGVLVTYAAKGSVRRAMLDVGFLVERLPGPPGKREMLRGIKK
ncbi:MAG: tRNA (5-methylaminomethyl-2-thiouridine)(34)-methyltransferase MnmD [Bacteroidota bacterium]